MTLVLYHGNCYDGFGAAWAAWKILGDKAKYVPANYGDAPPELINADQGKLYLLDFSYPRETMLALSKEFDITVLDHHKTAQAALSGLDYATFNLNKSGAMLAWDHFLPNIEAPLMVAYLQDRDLWKFELPHSREISAWMRSWPFDFLVWNELALKLEYTFTLEVREGEAILRFQSSMVNMMADNSWQEEIGGHLVPVTNATLFFSEVGEELCLRNPKAPFSGYYLDRKDGKRQWGLRSRGGFDCSEVAKKMGGGGHPGASGWVEEIR